MTKTEPDSSPHLTFIGRWSIFLVGMGGVAHEAFIRTGDPRESLLVMFGLMMSLPGFVRLDNMIGRARRVVDIVAATEEEDKPKKDLPS